MPDEEGREARMSQRAAARRPADYGLGTFLFLGSMMTDVADRNQLRRRMTLGDLANSLRRPPYGCACRGAPNCCMNVAKVERELQRGAHILVKQLADLAARKAAADA